MGQDARSPDNDVSGMRRRHSGQEERDSLASVETNDANVGRSIVQSQPNRSASDSAPSSGRMGSSGNDVESSSSSRPGDHPRVRFSSDIERRPSAPKPPKRKISDEDITPQPGPSNSQISGTPELSIDTSPGRRRASESENVRSPPHSASNRATSPYSPRGRNRGLSLRSSIFQKGVRGRSQEGSVIEMQDVGPSDQTSFQRQRSHGASEKKSIDTVVEISPVSARLNSWPNVPDTPKKTGIQGPSALPNYRRWLQRRTARNAAWRRIKTTLAHARKFILRINEIPPSKDGRHIALDPSHKAPFVDERTGRAFIQNTIRSSRYSVYNFLPRQLWAQFSKVANFYFLVVSILQMIPGLSTTGTYTTIIPLLFFVMISMAKEGYDDLRRYRLDKVENNREAEVLRIDQPLLPVDDAASPSASGNGSLGWSKRKWQNIRVGDVVRLSRDESVPADIVLLSSTGPNGIANIETMALDGETNLKSKQTPQNMIKLCDTPEAIAACKAEFVVEDPNLDLYNFEGRVRLAGQTSPVTNNEIIYRGSVIRNTPEAVGMVIYTGEECKIRMNANKTPRIKAPALQAVVNKVVIVIVIFVLALAIFNTVAYQVWRGNTENKSWYLSDATVAFFPILVSFIIMFNTMIPLSLYVSLEIIKLCQMLLLNDIDMYDEASNTPFEARTSTINEELGQISYVFSDKTGTLTENVMKFRKLSVAGTAWLHDVDLPKDGDEQRLRHKKRKPKGKGKKPMTRSGTSTSEAASPNLGLGGDGIHDESIGNLPRKSTSQWTSSARPDKAQPELSTKALIKYVQRRPYTVFAAKARMLLLSIALCHTCLPENQEDGGIEFQASSPDELALLKAAQELNYIAVNRDANILSIKTFPHGKRAEAVIEDYEIMDVIEFSSKRKRMSVLVRFPKGRIALICKGADTVVMNRLRLATLANEKVLDIDKRVSRRKSLEAEEALRRRSEQNGSPTMNRSSFTRASVTLSRRSMGGVGRPSTSTKLQPIRDEVDTWLTEREQDVKAPPEDVEEYYTPRPSLHNPGKPSLAISEARSSYELDEDETDELVEEGLAIDDAAIIERCFQHINDFATEGLRTLLYGHRFLDEQEYLAWKKNYLDATTSLVDRQAMVEKVGDLIEQNLELGGATAIEDKLQHGVPEAIDKLRRAHIKMWMLTGDKRETAINIGHSCRLIKDYSSVTVLDREAGHLEQRIAAAILDIQGGNVAHSVIVIDGQTLALVEAEAGLRKLFLDLAISADSVICCRASPSQKASLVKAIRRRVKHSVTLAIGDGANDIAMIQEAHVGIGITGKEGLQAARSSDYSIAQFRFLTKLLLVHGRWNYIRICKYTAGTFWKETMFYLVQAMYQRYAGYTGTSLYESWSLSVFNTLFTSLCVIFLGIFEKDLQASTLLAVPELYAKGQRNRGFNFKVYLSWMFMAASESMIIFFTMWGLFGMASFTLDNDLFAMGDLAFTACIILINIKLQVLEIHNKSIMALIATVVSIGGWFLWNILLAVTYKSNQEYHVKGSFFTRFGRNPLWWLTLILTVISTIYYEIAVRSIKAAYWPTDVDTFQCLEQDLGIRKRFEEASAMELQTGWHRGSKKSSTELAREGEEEARREKEVQEMLNRPRVMEEGKASSLVTREERVMVDDGPSRRSTDIQEMLSRGFGKVRQDTLFRG